MPVQVYHKVLHRKLLEQILKQILKKRFGGDEEFVVVVAMNKDYEQVFEQLH